MKGLSSPGKRDGLYWASLPGEPESPLGAGFADAKPGQAYHGYLYRVLTAQGKDAPGGAKSYVKNGLMTEGYALVAWPERYGDTGVMTFIVNRDGVVYEKNLGPNTAALARGDDRLQSGRELGEGRTAETVASPGSGAPPAVTGRRPPRAAYRGRCAASPPYSPTTRRGPPRSGTAPRAGRGRFVPTTSSEAPDERHHPTVARYAEGPGGERRFLAHRRRTAAALATRASPRPRGRPGRGAARGVLRAPHLAADRGLGVPVAAASSTWRSASRCCSTTASTFVAWSRFRC